VGLHPAEQRLLALIRAFGYGKIELKIVNGHPAQIEVAVYQVKLL